MSLLVCLPSPMFHPGVLGGGTLSRGGGLYPGVSVGGGGGLSSVWRDVGLHPTPQSNGGHRSRRYASYCNAFLFLFTFRLFKFNELNSLKKLFLNDTCILL